MLLWLDYKKLQSANTKTNNPIQNLAKILYYPARYLWHFTLFYVPQIIKKAEFKARLHIPFTHAITALRCSFLLLTLVC